ncbi:hypothetical protein M413DRAFT_29258 [Hebeloma cylindrosporum]|uniref:Uncharacterized protein n=1 Tax=Hebeloma cylindrosporum TaxID=76867 RepID=A0A0C3BS58_HEBCY|nr:hypothetical protein M413DRAFT_29258 [Hebeloma cylindrosporum h7]
MTQQLIPTGFSEQSLVKRARGSIQLLEETGTDSRTVRASIKDLPVELLVYIFQECVEQEIPRLSPQPFRSYLYPTVGVVPSPPMVFLQICRRWRDVAYSTSSLWTSLSGGEIYWDRSGPTIPAMRYCLDRSKQAPLHLRLYSSRRRHRDAEPSRANEMLRLFATEISRWRSFSIAFDEGLVETMAAILSCSHGQVDRLEELEVYFHPGPIPMQSVASVLSSLLSRKSLQRLYLNYSRDFTTFNFQLVPWNRLNEILIQARFSLEECVRYLSQCSSASRVSLYSPYPLSDLVPICPDLPITTLPNLSSLILSQQWDAIKVLEFFDLPSLRHLTLRTNDTSRHGGWRGQPSIFKRFLERSKCSIAHLTILDPRILMSTVVEYFKIPALHRIPRVGFSSSRVCLDEREVGNPLYAGHDEVRASRNAALQVRALLNAQRLFPRIHTWKCPETRGSYFGWGGADEEIE